MLLTGDNTSVELRLIGWGSELEAGEQRDETDWLDIQAVVTDASGPHDYRVSFDVVDALRLAPWLRDVAAGDVPPSDKGRAEDALLSFIEPGFAVELMSRDELTASTQWYFYEPRGQVLELLAFNARIVNVSCTRADLLTCADAWENELASLKGLTR